MDMKRKRRHHYVWRHYLKAWASNDKIWCFREQKIFNPNLMGVAQERDFYKVEKLTNEELKFVNKLIKDPYCAEDAELNEGWLKIFQMGFEVEEQFKKHQPGNEKILEVINIQLHNYEEDLHAKIEETGIKYVDALLSKDTSFYQEPEKCIEFLHFIALQYFRTKRNQKNVSNSVKNISSVNLERIWPILRHVYATQTAKSIYIEKEKFKLVLLINQTRAPLITGDQPIINTHAVEDRSTKEVDKLEFYYPLSNNIAILITKEKKYSKLKSYFLNFEEIAFYNEAIIKCSNEQVFSSCRESLEFFCS